MHKALEYKIQAKENMIVVNVLGITDSFKEQLTKEREILTKVNHLWGNKAQK